MGRPLSGFGKPTLLRVVFPFLVPLFQRVGFPLEGRPPKRCGKTTQTFWEDHPNAVGRPPNDLRKPTLLRVVFPFKKSAPFKGWASLGGKTTQWLWDDHPAALGRPPNGFGKPTLLRVVFPFKFLYFKGWASPWRDDHPKAVGRPPKGCGKLPH